ncbi:hypothetical protein F5051DRAFT_323983 [Lentinula edodes]|nr:hypothetical protein F5051DRAFT_323983 [Lentinula edodes]
MEKSRHKHTHQHDSDGEVSPDSLFPVSTSNRAGSSDGGLGLDVENDYDVQTKKHVCPECFKRFSRPSSLRIHTNTHTGITPFSCPYLGCGRRFNVSSNMRRHYRKHDCQSPGDNLKNLSKLHSNHPFWPTRY